MIRPIATEITDAIRDAKDRLPGAVLVVRHMQKRNGEVCSEGKEPAMKIYRKDDGWYFHCFRCGHQGFVADDSESPEELKRRWKKLTAHKSRESLEQITLPDDFQPMVDAMDTTIPQEAWHWFWKYQIKTESLHKYGIGWSDSYQRVIVPCRKTAILQPSEEYCYELLGWSGREVYCKTKEERKEKRVLKYLTKKSSHVKHLFFHAVGANIDQKRIVLVEDIISAMKIAELTGISAIALLTTYIPPKLMVSLRDYHITIWLDGDMLAKSVNYVTMYESRGFNVGRITTELDPKEYDYTELMDHLNPIGGSNAKTIV
jgi:hypothetical protein